MGGFYAANQSDDCKDDITLFSSESRDEVLCTLYGLRQQAEKPSNSEKYYCLSDFVAPVGIKDYVGLMAVSAGEGVEEMCEQFKEQSDDYSSIMAKVIADRLAEAFAEYLHAVIRRDMWGYSKEEDLNCEDLLKVKYCGIRPAPGYPTQPDHTEKLTMWQLLNVEENIGMKLSSGLAMLPASAVSALVFSHPQSKYFAVGHVNEDQIDSYSERKNESKEYIEKWCAPLLNYK